MPRETRNRPPLAASFAGASGCRPPEIGILRKEGEYWTVGYRNSAFRLKDTKGFAYLAHLLRYPGTEFHVLDLVGRNCQPARGEESRAIGGRLASGN